ncbi:MAG TPA: methyltransferase domain-containing protein [Pyrinomonadaceae bacterium]|jgi:O-antigen chain-terminating methyltransferase|nr:methyltransferase domain-containing protein [Pyrinomonadaceae bacterium]
MNIEIEKNDSATDGLDLTKLMNQIRKDAEQRKRDSLQNGAPPFYPRLLTQGFDGLLSQGDPPLPDLKLQPALEKREQYQLSYLLGFHDEAFIRNAYKVILKREPDDSGFVKCLENLRSGRYSKIDILRSLKFSPEGRNANVNVNGLGRLTYFRKLYRVPVAGYLLRLIAAIVRLPVLIANHRQLESHTMAQLERVANHVNDVAHHFSEASRKQVEVNRGFYAIQEQLNDLKSTLRLQIDSLISEQGKIVQTQNSLQADLYTKLDETNAHTKELRDLQAAHAAELQALKARLEKEAEGLIERLQNSRMDLAQQETRLLNLLDGAAKSASAMTPVLTSEEDHLLDSLYFSLEDTLRGTPTEIKEEVKVYLPVLHNAGITADILDVGCGRGEWLTVLKEAGLQARGIDQNRIVVQRCRELELDVEESEALTYLTSLGDGSLNAVTAFHFAEHLPLERLVWFFDEAGRTLKPGGLLILETPNPENLLVGSCNFYLDPTHKNPIPIPTMQLLLEARGFLCQEVMKLHPVASARIEVKDQLTSHLNHFLYGPMNYAVVARKPCIETP